MGEQVIRKDRDEAQAKRLSSMSDAEFLSFVKLNAVHMEKCTCRKKMFSYLERCFRCRFIQDCEDREWAKNV